MGAQYSSPEHVAQLTQVLTDANMLRLNLKCLRDLALRDPWVKEAQVRRSLLARRVDIIFVEREPVGRVELKEGGCSWVDAEGVLLGAAPGAVLVGVQARDGRVSREAARAAQSLEGLAPAFLSSFPIFDASDPASVVAQSDDLRVLCGPIGQLGQTLGILEHLWGQEDLSPYTEVDLRWKGEVILRP